MASQLAPAQRSPETIRALRAENPKARARDFAAAQGITEADLVAAHVGHGVTAIAAHPDRLMPHVQALGEVMALTRNESCVHERVGSYLDFRSGPHASMVLGEEIDLRFFAQHWVHGFAVEETDAEGAVKRSVQVFDAAGDAIHKIHLKPASDIAAFARLVDDLRLPEQAQTLVLSPRRAVDAPRGEAARADDLRAEWAEMTDTHQFLGMVARLKMNRLGANRLVGAPWAEPVVTDAVTRVLEAAAEKQIGIMIFVGNAGCIQIHGGTVGRIVPMGPWINVMDPRFNLHLRADHIAEVWCVTKPTRTGDAISIEAFDADGALILQIFGLRKEGTNHAWDDLARGLPRREEAFA